MDDRSPAPLWLTSLLLAAFGLCTWQMLADAPELRRVARARVVPGDEHRPLILGRTELGQQPGERAADVDHLRLHHDETGWWIANVSERRRVDAPTSTSPTRYLRRFPLATGTRCRLDGVDIEVLGAGPGHLELRGPNETAVRWDDGLLTQDQPLFADCPREGAPGKAIEICGLHGHLRRPERR